MDELELEDEWQTFLDDGCEMDTKQKNIDEIPKCPKTSHLRISTKVKILWLSIKSINIYKHFWDLPTIKYWEQKEGIIKKQIKYTCNSKKEYESLIERIDRDPSISRIAIKRYEKEIVDNSDISEAKSVFKDVSKITVGISNKELINCRIRKKGAFYNCFMLVVRIEDEGAFKEVNIKIFNTGKVSFPGMLTFEQMDKALMIVISILSRLEKKEITYHRETIETVLINSNFNCGYFIDRDALYNILKFKYKLHASYDQCSYPGIQCKYFYNVINENKDGRCICKTNCTRKGDGRSDGKCRDISFMIFRTGSVLIVGKSDETLLYHIYEFLKKILQDNYEEIFVSLNTRDEKTETKKQQKQKYFYINK